MSNTTAPRWEARTDRTGVNVEIIRIDGDDETRLDFITAAGTRWQDKARALNSAGWMRKGNWLAAGGVFRTAEVIPAPELAD